MFDACIPWKVQNRSISRVLHDSDTCSRVSDLDTKYSLNAEQKNAVEYLSNVGEKFNVSVLIGITGSGKTLVYFERIKKLIKQNKQALILIPEIFLTTQFKKRFEQFFGYEPAIWHSKISKNKKKIFGI